MLPGGKHAEAAKKLSDWCARHGIALGGHPAGSMDIGAERHFQIPGQDLVWRYVVPGPSAIAGEHSTMAKCASSAMLHLGRRRNSNELYGAYGHELTFVEMRWLAHWCLVRGHNLLYPHAFYYSVRGPRRDERPPDVGPNAVWWPRYKPFADSCRRLCWLNTDSRHVCDVAILAEPNRLPDSAARVCFQHQHDFNYVELRHLWEDATLDTDGVHLAGMTYRAVIVDGALDVPAKAKPALRRLAADGRLITWGAASPGGDNALSGMTPRRATTDLELVQAIGQRAAPEIAFRPASTQLRCRHVVKAGRHVYLLFNEEAQAVSGTISLPVAGAWRWLDPATGAETDARPDAPVNFGPHEMRVLSVVPAP